MEYKKTWLEKQSQVRLHVNEVANIRRDISSECLKLSEINLKQERANAEKFVILKTKTDTHKHISSLDKPLESYYIRKPNQATIKDVYSMVNKLKEKNDDLIIVMSMLPKVLPKE